MNKGGLYAHNLLHLLETQCFWFHILSRLLLRSGGGTWLRLDLFCMLQRSGRLLSQCGNFYRNCSCEASLFSHTFPHLQEITHFCITFSFDPLYMFEDESGGTLLHLL